MAGPRKVPTAVKTATSAADDVELLLQGFQELSLSPYEARVILALLRRGTANSVQLAELSGVPRTAVYPVLQGLGRKGLAEQVPGPGPAVWASFSRDRVIAALKEAESERVRQHYKRADDVRELLDRSVPETPADVALPFVHLIPDVRHTKAAYDQLLDGAHSEVMMFTRPAAAWPFVDPNQAVLDLLASGVRMRVIYEANQWRDPSSEPFRAAMTVYHEAGVEARVTDTLLLHVVVVDRRDVMVHMAHPLAEGIYPTTLHVEHPGFAEVMALTFEQAWAGAGPVPNMKKARSSATASKSKPLHSAG